MRKGCLGWISEKKSSRGTNSSEDAGLLKMNLEGGEIDMAIIELNAWSYIG